MDRKLDQARLARDEARRVRDAAAVEATAAEAARLASNEQFDADIVAWDDAVDDAVQAGNLATAAGAMEMVIKHTYQSEIVFEGLDGQVPDVYRPSLATPGTVDPIFEEERAAAKFNATFDDFNVAYLRCATAIVALRDAQSELDEREAEVAFLEAIESQF